LAHYDPSTTLPHDANGNIIGGPGRPKGFKVKPKQLTLNETLESKGFNTIDQCLKLIEDPTCPHAVRGRLLEVFLRCTYPTVRSSEINKTVETRSVNIRMNIDGSAQQPSHTVGETVDQSMLEHAMTVDPLAHTVGETVTTTVETDE
jgi:hypothetical protein